jgi:hypothetical protein
MLKHSWNARAPDLRYFLKPLEMKNLLQFMLKHSRNARAPDFRYFFKTLRNEKCGSVLLKQSTAKTTLPADICILDTFHTGSVDHFLWQRCGLHKRRRSSLFADYTNSKRILQTNNSTKVLSYTNKLLICVAKFPHNHILKSKSSNQNLRVLCQIAFEIEEW